MEAISAEYRIQFFAIFVSLLLILLIVRLIVKGKLREEYSIIWIVGASLLLLFSIWRDGIDMLGDLFGVYSAPNLFFFAAILMIFIYLLHLSVVLSNLQKQNKTLAQEIALLKRKNAESS